MKLPRLPPQRQCIVSIEEGFEMEVVTIPVVVSQKKLILSQRPPSLSAAIPGHIPEPTFPISASMCDVASSDDPYPLPGYGR